jgi:hypothetical protein
MIVTVGQAVDFVLAHGGASETTEP